MATVRELYDTDFALDVLSFGASFVVQRADARFDVPVRLHFSFTANAKYVSCYLDASASQPDVCRALIEGVGQTLTIADGLETQTGFEGEDSMSSKRLVFAGRLFIYHDGPISDDELSPLKKLATDGGLAVQFRGPAYAVGRTQWQKPLAFISHDSRDKDEIARPLAVKLAGLQCPVWFDEFSLPVGARLRESIEGGIREARKCVLVLTPHFLSNDGWTKTEFNSIFTREMIERTDVVLPVWSGVTAQQVYEYSSTLADRVAVDWSLGADEVAARLRRSILQ